MRKRILLGLLTAALTVALTGCGLRAPEELLRPARPFAGV